MWEKEGRGRGRERKKEREGEGGRLLLVCGMANLVIRDSESF